MVRGRSIIIAMIFGVMLTGCGAEGLPEVNAVNCSGRGMEQALDAFRNQPEELRQAFIDGCEALLGK